jgi:LysM repeat protein
VTDQYTVARGDSLWSIAQAHLGNGHQWKRLWRYNNRADVVKKTGRGISDPNLIYPGQILLLPVLPEHVVRRPPPTQDAPVAATRLPRQPERIDTGGAFPAVRGTPALPPVTTIESPISIKFHLKDLRFPPIIQPGAILEMKLAGDVVLTSKRTYPAVYVTQRREIEAQAVMAANHAFGRLLAETELSYNAPSNTMTYRSMLVSQSHVANAPATAVGVQMDSNNPIPRLRFEFVLPKSRGHDRRLRVRRARRQGCGRTDAESGLEAAAGAAEYPD